MFEFFIALFGGAHYGKKFYNDRVKTNDYDNNYKGLSDVNNKIWLPHDLPYSLLWYEMKDDKEKRIDVINSVYTELEEIFGADWRNLYRDYHKNFSTHNNSRYEEYWIDYDANSECRFTIWTVAFNIWISKKGYCSPLFDLKARQKEFCGGLPIELFYDGEKNYEFAWKYINIILCNLKKYHPDVELHIRNHKDILWVIACPYGDINITNMLP